MSKLFAVKLQPLKRLVMAKPVIFSWKLHQELLETGGIAQLTSWLLSKKCEGAASLSGDESVIVIWPEISIKQLY